MWDSFLFSFNALFPVIVVIAVGYFLRHRGIVNASFVEVGSKFAFVCPFACVVFKNLYDSDFSELANGQYILYIVAAGLTTFLCAFLIIRRMKVPNEQKSVMIQGCYRSNILLLGISLCQNMFGAKGTVPMAIALTILVPIYNVLATFLFSYFAPDRQPHDRIDIKVLLLSILKNPFIAGSLSALTVKVFELLVFNATGFTLTLPVIIYKPISDFAGIATTLALALLGAQLDFSKIRGNIRIIGGVTFARLVLWVSIFVPIAVMLGFRGPELGAIFVIFASPVAASSYIMAQTMGGDGDLAAQLLLSTNLFSILTIFVGIFTLRVLGLF